MLNEKKLFGLWGTSSEKRYRNFLNTVTDYEEIWLISSEQGIATLELNGIIHILVWPRKEFCELFLSKISNELSTDDQPFSIEIHNFLKQCENYDETLCFMVFPTDKDAYMVTKNQLCVDIKECLQQLE